MAKQFVFFDSKAVQSAVDRGTRKALSKFGAFVRTRAKSSIRKRKRVSLPGAPPSSHSGKLKKYVYFGYDARQKSVVVGPVAFSNSKAQSLLEHGGSARATFGRRNRPRVFHVGQRGPLQYDDVHERRRWARLHTEAQAGRATRIYNESMTPSTVVYRPRPYMNPAFRKELGNIKKTFTDCIR